ncbi:MAG: SMP-30/gluconolactonase/LRE family protein [Bryobacterales bacterium]|nr:SMP-30/gluconolactonase/LRE family protein [Bryobacterales bacterium]
METIARFGELCGEGPVWDPEPATLYWTDLTGNRFFRYRGGVAAEIHRGLEICGFRLDARGGFTIANSGGVWHWDGSGEPVLIVSEAGGSLLKINDCTADAAGRLIAGSKFYQPAEPFERGKLWSVGTDGRATVLDDGFELPNGIGFSPDSRTLYFTDSTTRRIYAYDYNLAAGTAKNRRVFVQVPSDEGLPDGLTVDAAGFVWSAQWYAASVVRYDPDGKVERRIPLPAKQTSAVTFGGTDLDEIYVTSAAQSEPMPLMPPGYDWRNGLFGGEVYRVKVDVQGRPEHRTSIGVPPR